MNNRLLLGKPLLFAIYSLFIALLAFQCTGCRNDLWGNYSADSEIAGVAVGTAETTTLSGIITKSTTTSSAIKHNVADGQAAQILQGATIKGAEVWIEELPDIPHQTSDEKGAFTFRNLPLGKYHIIAKYLEGGKLLKKRTEEVPTFQENSPESKVQPVELLDATNVVSGILRDEDGKPLPEGIELTLWGEKFFTGPGGTFTSPPVPAGVQVAEIKVKAQQGRKQRTFEAPFISADQPVIIDIRLPSQDSTDTPPPNPFITGVKNGLFTNEVFPGETIDLTAKPGDFSQSEREKLSYKWEATLGVLSAKSNLWEYSWKASAEGRMATVTVTVTDEKGRTGLAHFRTGNKPQTLAGVSFSWGSGLVDYTTTSAITVAYGQKLVPSSLSASTFKVLLGDQQLDGTLKLLDDQRTIQFTFAGSLQPGTTYTVVLTTGLRGVTGGTLAADEKATFTTIGTLATPVISGLVSSSFAASQKFTITGGVGSTLEYSLDNGANWTTYTGEVSLSSDGTYTVVARQRNSANTSPTTTAMIVVIDMTAPAAPTVTFSTTPAFTISGETGTRLEYSLDNGTTWKAYSAAVSLTAGTSYQVLARQTDGAGNVSSTTTATYSGTTTSPTVAAPTITSLSQTSGPAVGGTSVTLTGTNLTGATAVTFRGTAATSFTVDSATQITATTPAHTAGAVNVVVTTPIGSATKTGGFSYWGPNFYICDRSSNSIVNVNPTQTGSTFANGALFDIPTGSALDSAGNLYVGNSGATGLLKVTPAGVVTTFLTQAAVGGAPGALAIDSSGNIYASSWGTNKVYKITTGGVVSVFATGFNAPNGLVFDTPGNLFVANYSASGGLGYISKVTSGGVVTTFAPNGASLQSPDVGMAFDSSGNLYVSSVSNSKILKINTSGTVTDFATLSGPEGLVFSSDGTLYCATLNGRIMAITPGGVVSTYYTHSASDMFYNIVIRP